MYCSNCGAFIENGFDFCSACGTKISASVNENVSAQLSSTEIYEETGKLDEADIPNWHSQPTEYQSRIVPAPGQTNQTNSKAQIPPLNQGQIPNLNENLLFQKMTEKDFYKKFASKNTNSWAVAIIVACFITAATSIPSLFLGNYLSLIDLVFYLVFGILLVLKKKWYLVLPVTICSGIGTIIAIASAGAATGIFALVAGIISTIKLKKINAAYKQYQKNDVLPQNLI